MLIGSCIPEDDIVWRFYLLAMEVVDLCCCTRLSCDALIDLEVSLQVLLHEFKTVHPNCIVIPKMHFLLLYPYLMKQVGPLSQFSCMRFESKHKFMKNIVTQRNNYKNVPYTIALNHQLALATALSQKDLYSFQLSSEGCRIISAALVFEKFGCCPTTSVAVTEANKVTVDGIKYVRGSVLCVGVSSEGVPDFLKIKQILLDVNDNVAFVGCLFNALNYDHHFHGWRVHDSSKNCFCFQKDLVYPHSIFCCVPISSSERYVCPKFYLDTTVSAAFFS